MIKKVVTKRRLEDSEIKANLEYWLSRPVEERLAAVEFLRRQHHGDLPRLQRVVRVVKRVQNKRATGRKKDLADIEALGEE